MIKKPKNKNHHGNLREALILAGMKLLEEDGLEALTLRKCAILAGVSPAAPSHHFDGIKGLRTAIAVRGYKIFDRITQESIAAAEPSPHAQALCMSLGYVKFATEHNALFNLMIDRPDKFTGEPDWLEATQNSNKIFRKICTQFQPGKGGAEAIETVLFSLAHGYVKLIEIERVTPGSNDSRDIKFEDIFSMINFVVKPD